MKIVCDACGAKYSIADEKVSGKVFKIRCKKCSGVIVVRGDQPAAASAAPLPAADAVWQVAVNGETRGPLAPAEIGELLAAGTIDWEAFVWREGFEGWCAARDVQELVDAVMGGASPQPAAEPAEAPATAAPARRHAGADLFAASDPAASPFSGGGDDDVVASAPSA